MKRNNLNDLYKQFIEKKITRSKFESKIYIFYLKNQSKTCLAHWKTDDYEDFVSWFYPRIKKAIDKFIDTGVGFDTFINKYFLLASREYRINTTTNNIIEYSAWCARIPDLYVYEEEPEYNFESKKDNLSEIIHENNGRRNIRRVLALILKCYSYISDDFIEKVAPLLDMKPEDLKNKIEKIRKLRQKNDDDLYFMKEKHHTLYYRCIVLERRLLLSEKDSSTSIKLENQLKNARIKLEKSKAKLNQMRKEASNSQIAQVIGIHKGSVDSSLHKLKEKFNLN